MDGAAIGHNSGITAYNDLRARRIPLPMGVRLLPKSARYQARIGFHNKQIHLGAFDTPQEAHSVYSAKRKELYGEFA